MTRVVSSELLCLCASALFPLNDYSLQAASPNVWERTDTGVIEEEDMDVELWLQCHDYNARQEPAALDIGYEITEAN